MMGDLMSRAASRTALTTEDEVTFCHCQKIKILLYDKRDLKLTMAYWNKEDLSVSRIQKVESR